MFYHMIMIITMIIIMVYHRNMGWMGWPYKCNYSMGAFPMMMSSWASEGIATAVVVTGHHRGTEGGGSQTSSGDRSMYLIDSTASTPDSTCQLIIKPLTRWIRWVSSGLQQIVKMSERPQERFENHTLPILSLYDPVTITAIAIPWYPWHHQNHCSRGCDVTHGYTLAGSRSR